MRVTKHAGRGDSNYGLTQIMKLVIALVFVAVIALLNATQNPPRNAAEIHVTETASAQAPAIVETKPQEKPAEPSKPVFNASDPSTWPKCADGEIVRADNGQCSKPAAAPAAAATVAPSGAVSGAGVGDCAAEIAKYDWNVNVATAVARAESGLNAGSLNNNPSTGDYSVGCFQVNLYGANARTRPSEAQLKNAAINVQWAYNNYVANGHSFIGQWGVCRSKVACY